MLRLFLFLFVLGSFTLRAEQDTVQYENLTPTHMAAMNGDTEALKKALKTKPEDIKSQTGSLFCNGEGAWETPLHLAILYEHKNCVKLLLELGADPSAVNFSGKTPLHYACAASASLRFKMMKWLIGKNAALNTRDNEEHTALDSVTDVTLRKYLIGKGAKAGQPKTALDPTATSSR